MTDPPVHAMLDLLTSSQDVRLFIDEDNVAVLDRLRIYWHLFPMLSDNPIYLSSTRSADCKLWR